MSNVYHASYHRHLHKPDELLVAAKWVKTELARRAPDAQAIVARGMSGVVVASVASALTGLPLVIVRKPEDKHHSCAEVQGPNNFTGPYIVVDDFIASGETMHAIMDACNAADCGQCVGIFLYDDIDNYPHGWEHTTPATPIYVHRFQEEK